MATCPKCKAEDQEGEELRDFILSYECSECGHTWDDSESMLSAIMERGKNIKKYGGLS